jgi:predicted DNA-binding transcriptional regulator YafY
VRVVLHVSNDVALRSWILGFGPLARVVSPPELVAQVTDELERARQRYDPE